MSAALPRPLSLSATGPLKGTVTLPGDKSISHRALMFAGLSIGESRIDGLLEGEDVLATAAALTAMGVTIDRDGATWRVTGVGVGGLLQPATQLQMGNSGTSTRLLMGLVASHPITATFVGDASLSGRPMGRVVDPLTQMGAMIDAAPGERLPLTVRGLTLAIPIRYTLPVASAQVKSAILLAALNTPGLTTVIEPIPTRDHSERMLRAFGAELSVEGNTITLRGEAELRAQDVTVPGDPSSAAFWIVAATIVPGSDIVIGNVVMNPTRFGLVAALRAMGADITVQAERHVGGEPVGDLRIRHATLTGIEVPPDLVPAMIDELPALFVAAAFAAGSTVVRGAEELRVKESDRIAVMAKALGACGVPCTEASDGMTIVGSGGEALAGGVRVATMLDHRIAMSMAVAGLRADRPIELDDAAPIATSYPDFVATATKLGIAAYWPAA